MKKTVSFQLVLLVAAFIIGLAAMSVLFYNILSNVKVNGPIYAQIVQNKDLVADILPPPEYILESHLLAFQMVADEKNADLDKNLAKATQLQSDFNDRHKYWDENLPDSPTKSALLNDSYKPAVEYYKIFNDQFLPAIKANDRAKAHDLLIGPMTEQYAAHRAAIDHVVTLAGDDTTAIEKSSKASLNRSMWLLGSVVSGILLAVSLLGFFIGRGIVKPLRNVAAALAANSDQARATATQVSSSSQSIAQGASEQAAALEETTSALQEISSMTKNNADTARKAAQLATDAQTSANRGAGSMQSMSKAIGDIEKSAAETAKIIKVIDEIAFQTNLLALNAAVEAARAGEAGKGFAVVAEEVRNLAIRSADAAKNTASLIESSVTSARNGVTIATEVAKSLDEITGASDKVNSLVAEIAAASNEQAQGIDQVNTAVAEMDKVTQSNAAGAEQSAAAAEELSSQAGQLRSVVDDLVQLVGGKSAKAVTSAAVDSTPPAISNKTLSPRTPTPAAVRKSSTRTTAREIIPLENDAPARKSEFAEFSNP
ncbi:MAG TPA: methyl-accepting chemotaxis protein [Phycisphaerae bacterium]|nr:methyl-accepting chemotaxis protein [Phycisphaerae bacterium]